MRSLLSSKVFFVSCDRKLQRAYSLAKFEQSLFMPQMLSMRSHVMCPIPDALRDLSRGSIMGFLVSFVKNDEIRPSISWQIILDERKDINSILERNNS